MKPKNIDSIVLLCIYSIFTAQQRHFHQLTLEQELDKFGWMMYIVRTMRILLHSALLMGLGLTIVVMGKMLELDVTIRHFLFPSSVNYFQSSKMFLEEQ